MTLRANVEGGRKVLEGTVHVYTPALNPLARRWTEVAQMLCPWRAFVRGDVDGSGRLDITDAIHLLSYLFLDAPTPGCLEAVDANGDRVLNIADGITILGYLFLDRAAPPAPFPACGADDASMSLPCDVSGACSGVEVAPLQVIEELIFEADGTFSVTWTPFEIYKDYWGTYTFDLASGAIELRIEGGNISPGLWSYDPRFSLRDGDLVLEGLSLGTRDTNSPFRPICGHRFR